MGTYCTTTSLDTLMLGLSFDSATTALADKCIDWAEAEINKHLSDRYDLSSNTFQTSTSVPPMVRMWCEQLSQGYMWQNISRGSKESLTRGQNLIDLVVKNLHEVSEDSLNIADSIGSIISDNGSRLGVLSNTEDYHSTFDEDDPLNWNVDEDKLSSISDNRD